MQIIISERGTKEQFVVFFVILNPNLSFNMEIIPLSQESTEVEMQTISLTVFAYSTSLIHTDFIIIRGGKFPAFKFENPEFK